MTQPKKSPAKARKSPAVETLPATPEAIPAPQAETPSITLATRPAPGGKIRAILELLRREDGATIEAMTQATGWQAHSVRGAIAGTLKKKLGLTVASDKVEGVRVYRVLNGVAA